jgi:prepilin-type N-terminal cleavage/methylation domain-containing protein
MRNKGFTIIEMMVSLVVLLVVIAITVSVITYQSRLAVYKIQATSAQQAVETALVLIRNDLMQAGRWAMATTSKDATTLFIKYNGFLNLEAPSTPAENCTKLRSASCPSCDSIDCGSAWTKVVSSNSFTMDRFPKFYWEDETSRKSIFLGALSLKDDCKTLEGGAQSLTVTASSNASDPMQTLTFDVSSVLGSSSFKAGSSYASPAIVYQCINNKLLRNGAEILGGDISVQSLTFQQYPLYWSVIVDYQWKSRLPTSESVTVPSTQEIRVGIPSKYVLRVGG